MNFSFSTVVILILGTKKINKNYSFTTPHKIIPKSQSFIFFLIEITQVQILML